MLSYEIIGGWRAGPYTSFFRRFKSGQVVSNFNNFDFGFLNGDLQGSTWNRFRYAPFKQGDIWFGTGRSFESINPNDAFINQFRISNFIKEDYLHLAHQIELFNGFYFETGGTITRRQSIDDFENDEWINNLFEENAPLEFEDYNALVTNVILHYTPFQKYKTEPNRKIILGSKWPSFHLHHQKGWEGPLNSIVNFDYLNFSVNQTVSLRQFGSSKYNAQVGTFVNSKNLRFLDVKRFNQSNPFLFSDGLNSFQALDTALTTDKFFFEFHHIHHFNGAIVNNIPLLKKTRMRVVVGGGMVWMKENNFRHEEIFGGLERVFKLGPRRRLRLGLYYVASNSNYTETLVGSNYKISFDIIDTWKKNWSF